VGSLGRLSFGSGLVRPLLQGQGQATPPIIISPFENDRPLGDFLDAQDSCSSALQVGQGSVNTRTISHLLLSNTPLRRFFVIEYEAVVSALEAVLNRLSASMSFV